MDKEVIERLTRVESKQEHLINLVTPLGPLILKHEKDIYLGKKIVGLLGAVFSAIGLWAATYFGSHR